MTASECPRILTMSRDEAEAFVPGVEDVCISIRSPGASHAFLSANFRDLLRLWFDDLGAWVGDVEHARAIESGGVELSEADAERIAEFAIRNRNACRLIVHCEAGISRSVAVALAIGSTLGPVWPFPRWYRTEWRAEKFVHNRRVFALVKAAIERHLQAPREGQ